MEHQFYVVHIFSCPKQRRRHGGRVDKRPPWKKNQVRPLDRFSRLMAQTTLLGDSTRRPIEAMRRASVCRRYVCTRQWCCKLRLKLHWFDFCGFVAHLFAKRVDNKSDQWSLSLTVHVCAKSRQVSVGLCSKVLSISTDAVACWIHSTSSSVIACRALWSIGLESASRGPSALSNTTCHFTQFLGFIIITTKQSQPKSTVDKLRLHVYNRYELNRNSVAWQQLIKIVFFFSGESPITGAAPR